MHYWFERPVQPPKQLEPATIKVEAPEKENGGSIPFAKLYADERLTEFVTWAIQNRTHYLTLSWGKNLPSTLYVQSVDAKASSDRLTLTANPDKEMGKPALYSIFPNEKVRIPYLAPTTKYPAKLIFFSDENRQIHIASGETYGESTIILKDPPSTDALALFFYKNEYIPYGVYDPQRKSIKPLLDFASFSSRRVDVLAIDANIDTALDNQRYYVLENDYQQLVFSNINGALVEINLPFKSKKNTKSVVREIEIDRILSEAYSYDDYFPQNPYQIGAASSSLISDRSLGGYYPLLRRNILTATGKISTQIPPYYYAFAIFPEQKEAEFQVYQLKRFEKNLIEFELSESNRRITKTFSFPAENSAPYCFDLTVRVEGDSRGLFLASGIPEAELISGNFSPMLKYKITKNKKVVIENLTIPKSLTQFSLIQPDWISNGNGFFGIIIDPLLKVGSGFTAEPIPGQVVPSRLTMIDARYNLYPADRYPGYIMQLPLNPSGGTMKFRIFAGPFENATLKSVDAAYTDPVTGYHPDYVSVQGFQGFFAFISEPFAKFLFILMNFFHQITHSWGISIILLTVALRIMLYPLNNWSIKSTAKLQEIAPQVTAIQEKYKKDPKRAQLEIMSLYREKKANPFSGCLPLLIQLPFLVGMFDLLKSTFELRGVPFIPGWIDNLTAPDILFSWNYPIIFFGNQFHLLPILLGIVMYIQQKYANPSNLKVKTALTDQQRQQKFMGNIMTIVFTVMFYHFPSGLNIYWLSSMLLGILQQWWTFKRLKAKDERLKAKG